ncbi:hypothetical protein HY989_06920 [Candidatus Micrarchaeota archaeon]|nr:hypothetical protein [Candidatus Micrarchaeota archaeon]
MKGKENGMNCGDHMYMDGILILIGLGYMLGLDGWGVINTFKLSNILPFWGTVFLFFGIKVYMHKHG